VGGGWLVWVKTTVGKYKDRLNPFSLDVELSVRQL
jgi:hypothetical protein